MPSAFRTPKNLAEWLRLDYFRYPRRLLKMRRALCWAVLLFCVAGLGAAALNRREPTLYQAGPLSPGHASFNNDCGQCHQENFATAQRFLPWKQAVTSVPDAACQKCHQNPPHNDNLLSTQNCASCHQEHRGHASLARLPDATCLTCHRDLKANSKNSTKLPGDVSGFPEVHPEFTGLKSDPSHLRFNHRKHLNLDISDLNNNIPVNMAPLEKLECASCHQPDAAGKYMQPIKYEANCKKCHPLSVQLGGEFGDDLKAAVDAFAKEPAPHAAPNIVRAVLRDRLVKFSDDHPLRLMPEETTQDARGMPGPKPSLDTDPQTRWGLTSEKMTQSDKLAFVQGQLTLAEQMCFARGSGCALCHVPAKTGAQGGVPNYAITNIPNRWFSRSHFDHRAHRNVDCLNCHAEAANSVQSSDVLMPGMQACAKCHSSSGGARNDCLECHTYHPRNHGIGMPRLSSGGSLGND